MASSGIEATVLVGLLANVTLNHVDAARLPAGARARDPHAEAAEHSIGSVMLGARKLPGRLPRARDRVGPDLNKVAA
jgi:hypothetical protein